MRYLKITSPDINNGLGFRVTLWVAGCSHHCKFCHNPETWDYNQGATSLKDELFEKLNKPYIKGLTLSGGDPLAQSDKCLNELYQLLVEYKKTFPGKDIWIYSGYTYEEAVKHPLRVKILSLCDVMVDGPYIHAKRDLSLPFRGSSNQRIIYLQNNPS